MLQACQFEDGYIYNGLAINGSAGAALTLKALIEALPSGALPEHPAQIAGVYIVPTEAVDVLLSRKGQAVPAGASGGGKTVVPTTGRFFDLLDPLERMWLIANAAGDTTATVELWYVNRRPNL